jgi:hypothetical protein
VGLSPCWLFLRGSDWGGQEGHEGDQCVGENKLGCSGVAENNTGIPFLDHMLDVSDFGLKICFNLIDFLILFLFLNLGLAVFSCRFPVSAFVF